MSIVNCMLFVSMWWISQISVCSHNYFCRRETFCWFEKDKERDISIQQRLELPGQLRHFPRNRATDLLSVWSCCNILSKWEFCREQIRKTASSMFLLIELSASVSSEARLIQRFLTMSPLTEQTILSTGLDSSSFLVGRSVGRMCMLNSLSCTNDTSN